jgi:hypothetical protein
MRAGNELDAISEHTWHVSFLPDNILLLQTPSAFRIYTASKEEEMSPVSQVFSSC